MRTLYYVPMIHSDKDLAELGPIVRDLKRKIYGEKALTHDEHAVDKLWEQIRTWVLKTVGDARGLIIYQDGMPVGPREKIRQLFDLVLAEHPESPLFRLTKELLDSGAILEGTEDFNLLSKRIDVYREIYQATTRCQNLQDTEELIIKRVKEQDDLVVQADRFIAKRINETLPEDGRSILFMGYRHKVDEELIMMRDAGLLSAPIKIHKLQLRIEKARR